MLKSIAPYRKAIVAGLAIFLGMLANSMEDGLTMAEVLAAAAGALTGGGATYAVPNAPAKRH